MENAVGKVKAMSRLRRLKPAIIGLIVLLLIGGTGFFLVWQLKTVAAIIVDDTLPGVEYAGQIDSELSENFVRTLLVVNTDSPEERERHLKDISQGSAKVDASMDGYRKSIFEKEDQEMFDHLVTVRNNYRAIRQRVFDLVREGKRNEGLQLFESELLPAYAAQKEAGNALFDYNVKQGQSRGVRIETLCRRTEWIMAVICMGMFLGGFFTPFIALRLPPHIWK
jgi:methyl-accepting chemotaxis protein WspA